MHFIEIIICHVFHVFACIRQYYTIIDFNEVDIRIYLPEKVIIHRGRQAEVNITLRVDKSLCLPKLK